MSIVRLLQLFPFAGPAKPHADSKHNNCQYIQSN